MAFSVRFPLSLLRKKAHTAPFRIRHVRSLLGGKSSRLPEHGSIVLQSPGHLNRTLAETRFPLPRLHSTGPDLMTSPHPSKRNLYPSSPGIAFALAFGYGNCLGLTHFADGFYVLIQLGDRALL